MWLEYCVYDRDLFYLTAIMIRKMEPYEVSCFSNDLLHNCDVGKAQYFMSKWPNVGGK